MQEQSRKTLLPGLKLSYEHPPLWRELFSAAFAVRGVPVRASARTEKSCLRAAARRGICEMFVFRVSNRLTAGRENGII